ncbi:hypothetical protein F4813DRAFT_158807 [Daldinia decipiens]|uniref:uncharacterized protein n=1 Tax=Daldinia decipiens TaxID=326647 RepID=UPI0020C28F13|nr:uncharacterized protein F4813DRAFT_158807 [Daldinia decipiens]KAI1655703.1 hypothetical protein F4813DRAFT_158807 [Daldinia decipiens]
MSTQKEMKVVNTSAPNKRIVGLGTDSVVSKQTSVAVAAKAAFESTHPSNLLAPKPPKRHFRKKFPKKKDSEGFPRDGAQTMKYPSLETCGTNTGCGGATVEPVDAAPAAATFIVSQGVVPGVVPHTTPDVMPVSPDDKIAHKTNDVSQKLVLEKFDRPDLNVDKEEFRNDMKKYGFKGLAASRWA